MEMQRNSQYWIVGRLKMTDNGAFVPASDQTTCERSHVGDYCMQSGKHTFIP